MSKGKFEQPFGEEPIAELEARIKVLWDRIVQLDTDARVAAERGERSSATSLGEEKEKLLAEHRALLQERAGRRDGIL